MWIRGNDSHKRFYRKSLETALALCRNQEKSPLRQRIDELKVNELPTNPKEAVKFALRKEIEEEREGDKKFHRSQDKLGRPFAPFYVLKDFHTGEITKRVSKPFSKYSTRQLDPFARFSFLSLDIKEMASIDGATKMPSAGVSWKP